MGLEVITADVPYLDDCPALTRMKCFVTQLGIVPTLEHVFRDKNGNPLDLTSIFPEDSESFEGQAPPETILRCKEYISSANTCNQVRQVTGSVTDALNGVAQFELDADMITKAGIYQLSIAIFDGRGKNVKIDNPILWVERSLFRLDDSETAFVQGPPSISEIRQAIIDSHAAENLLLQDVEFTDDQIANAVVRPIRYWNEQPPPLRPLLDTRNFPFQEAWINAIIGHLFMAASHNYRRNNLPTNAGGITIADKNKEPQYAQAGQFALQQYQQFVTAKKVEINVGLMSGVVRSDYGLYGR